MTDDTTTYGPFGRVLHMPRIDPSADLATVASAYGAAGLFVAPTSREGDSPGKNPGTLLGRDWPSRSVTGGPDAYDLFAETFTGRAVGVALHCGRSGLIVVDIDTEDIESVPPEIRRAIAECAPPWQTTRIGAVARGHYFFRQPPGRRIGNSLGSLGKGWGDLRGTNGVIVLAGSWHPADDGDYRQRMAGPIPELPAYVADRVPDGADSLSAVTDEQAQQFIDSTTGPGMTPAAMKGPIKRFLAEVARGGGRHDEATKAATWICREARAGAYAAGPALELLRQEFVQAVTLDPGTRRPGSADREWAGIVAWATAQALGETDERLAIVRERLARPAPVPPATSLDGGLPPLSPFSTAPTAEPDPAGVEAQDLTDAVMARKVYEDRLHDRFVWAVGFGWMKWNGMRWVDTAEETVAEEVRQWAIGEVKPQLSNVLISSDRELRQGLMGLLSAYRIKALTGLSRGLCQVDGALFDAEPHALNTPTGIVDLRTGETSPHDPNRYMTKITGANYRPGAEHQDWAMALECVPPAVADWLQVRFGQALTGHMTPDDVLLLLRGGGSNGKSTVLAAIRTALGGYATYVSDRVLLAESGAHPTELTEFRGARFALTEELPDEGRLNSKRLKDIIGTPTMTARKIRQDSITWQSTHSMFLSTNYLPKVTETDNGTWRRLALVDFPYTYVDATPSKPQERAGDPGLRDRVAEREEQQGAVLAWLVAGAARWYAADKRMPPQPAEVVRATRRWREQSDLILRFWSECLAPEPDHFVTSVDMLDTFNEWLMAQGHKSRSAQAFIPQFGEHEITRSHGVYFDNRKIRTGETQSCRPLPSSGLGFGASAFMRPTLPTGKQVRAWWGVRFVTTT